MTVRLLLLFALLAPAWLHAESPVALDDQDDRAIQLALRALKMTERDLAFQKTNVEAEFIWPAARTFLQQPLAVPVFGQSVFSNLSAVTTLADIATAAGTFAGTTNHTVRPAGALLTISNAPPAAVVAAIIRLVS